MPAQAAKPTPASNSAGAAKHRCASALSAEAGSTSSPTAHSQHQPSPIKQENLKEQKKLAPTVRGNWSLGEAAHSPRQNDCDNNSGVPSPTQALRTASVGSCRLRAAQCMKAFRHRRSMTWVEQLGHSSSVGFPRPPRRDDACGSQWAVNRQLLGNCRCVLMSATSTNLARKPGPRRQRCRVALLSAGGCHRPSSRDSVLASLPPTPIHQR